MSQRTCGCGRSLAGRRANAETCSDACRIKKHRREHPPIAPGPPLRDLVEAYQKNLETKTPQARERVAWIADRLGSLADRPIASIRREEWQTWMDGVTPGWSASSKVMIHRYVWAMLKGVPHWLPIPPQRPAVKQRVARPELLSSERMPKAERMRLVVELIVVGLYPVEVKSLTVTQTGELEAGPAAWGRRSRPEIPPTLQGRILAYASAQQIPAGAPLFPISSQAIRSLISRWLQKQTPCSSVAVAEET